MSVSTVEEVEKLENFEWDLNDPSLSEFAPDIDTSDIPKQLRPAPPPDGHYFVKARLGTRKEGPPVYIKGPKGPDGKIIDGKVIAVVDCRVFDRETGVEGAFLKTWWPTSQVFKGAKGSQLTAICYLVGKPVRSGASLLEIRNHVERVFAEAGEEGLELLVKTRWVKSVPQFQQAVQIVNGEEVPVEGMYSYVFDENGNKKYDPEIRGEKKIKALMLSQGIPEDQAHVWYDYVEGENRYVYAEVSSLEDPSLVG